MKQNAKVLVVEDEPLIRFDLSDHLTQEGYLVLEATNAAEAFELLDSDEDVGFMITDIDMPGPVDGLILAKFATERWPVIRIIVISGQQKPAMTDLPDGSVFLSKPYEFSYISRLMGNWAEDLGAAKSSPV